MFEKGMNEVFGRESRTLKDVVPDERKCYSSAPQRQFGIIGVEMVMKVQIKAFVC